MDQEKLYDEIRKIISEVTEVEEEKIQRHTRLVEDLGVDSMLALEILVAIEKKYNVKVPEDRLVEIKTLNDSVALAKEFIEKK